MDVIKIRDLEIYGHHGVMKEENVLGQKFLVSLALYTDTRAAGESDNLADSVNYAEVSYLVKEQMEKETYRLIEAAAEQLAKKILLKFPLVKKVEVEIKKPWAPILLPLDTVSVSITRGWETAYLSIGSNMGDRKAYLEAAIEELKKVGYGFMVKDQFPLIEKYAVPEDKIFEFFDYFSLEQLEDFEQSLNQYFNEESIIYHQDSYEEFESKEDSSFNRDILRLACGLTTYEDFIEDYTEYSISYYDLSLSKVSEYFRENEIKNLMDYGSDGDEGLYHLSSMYEEIMDKLGIKYSNVYTEDVSDGKYMTTITFENDSSIEVDTSAWNEIKVVTENMEAIYETYESLKEKSKQNEVKNENEFDYDFN